MRMGKREETVRNFGRGKNSGARKGSDGERRFGAGRNPGAGKNSGEGRNPGTGKNSGAGRRFGAGKNVGTERKPAMRKDSAIRKKAGEEGDLLRVKVVKKEKFRQKRGMLQEASGKLKRERADAAHLGNAGAARCFTCLIKNSLR